MEQDAQIVRTLNLPAMSQVGIVVKNLDKTISYYKDVLGFGPFVVPEITYTDTFYHGKPAEFKIRMAFCSLGPVEMEIVEPVSGPTIYQDFLRENGEGIHHLGFDIKDLDQILLQCKKCGINVLQSGRTPAGGFAYLKSTAVGGVIVEVIQRKSRRA